MERTANQLDVARAAGVSVSTVSRALSNQPGISENVRSRITKLAQELGYRARGDAGQAARVIRAYVTGNAAHAPKVKNRGTRARIGEKANSEERWKIHQQKTNCNLKYFVKCYSTCDLLEPHGILAFHE